MTKKIAELLEQIEAKQLPIPPRLVRDLTAGQRALTKAGN